MSDTPESPLTRRIVAGTPAHARIGAEHARKAYALNPFTMADTPRVFERIGRGLGSEAPLAPPIFGERATTVTLPIGIDVITQRKYAEYFKSFGAAVQPTWDQTSTVITIPNDKLKALLENYKGHLQEKVPPQKETFSPAEVSAAIAGRREETTPSGLVTLEYSLTHRPDGVTGPAAPELRSRVSLSVNLSIDRILLPAVTAVRSGEMHAPHDRDMQDVVTAAKKFLLDDPKLDGGQRHDIINPRVFTPDRIIAEARKKLGLPEGAIDKAFADALTPQLVRMQQESIEQQLAELKGRDPKLFAVAARTQDRIPNPDGLTGTDYSADLRPADMVKIYADAIRTLEENPTIRKYTERRAEPEPVRILTAAHARPAEPTVASPTRDEHPAGRPDDGRIGEFARTAAGLSRPRETTPEAVMPEHIRTFAEGIVAALSDMDKAIREARPTTRITYSGEHEDPGRNNAPEKPKAAPGRDSSVISV